MAKFRLAANAELDLLTQGELDESLRDWQAREWTERGRGEKLMRFAGQGLAGASLTGAAVIPYSPELGYVWNLRNLGIIPSATSSIRVYVVSDTSGALPAGGLVDTASAAANFQAFHWGSGQVWLSAGEFLALSGSAAVTVAYHLTALQVPAELAWKLM